MGRGGKIPLSSDQMDPLQLKYLQITKKISKTIKKNGISIGNILRITVFQLFIFYFYVMRRARNLTYVSILDFKVLVTSWTASLKIWPMALSFYFWSIILYVPLVSLTPLETRTHKNDMNKAYNTDLLVQFVLLYF